MPNKTTNYNLTKPLGNETVDISQINENFDIIDSKMFENKTRVDELNSNLVGLKVGENCGSKNYWNLGDTTATSSGFAFQNKELNLPIGTYTFSAYSDMAYEVLLYDSSGNKLSIANTEMNKRWSKTFTISSNVVSASLYVHAGTVKDIQIEEGTTATPYEPYIPSVKMLAEENAQQNTEAMDIKMLGWTVPKECPIQNYVDADGVFHQRVGRVDLGILNWAYNSTYKIFNSITPTDATIQILNGINIFTNKYTRDSFAILYTNLSLDKRIFCNDLAYGSNTICVRDLSYTDDTIAFKNAMRGVYLYYELATEKTISVDGNEAVTQIKNDLTPQTGNITFESDFTKEYGSIDKINGVVYLNISIYKSSDFEELNNPVKVGTLQNGYKPKYSVTMSLRYGFISIGTDGTINYTPTNDLTKWFGYSLTTCYIAQ